MDMVNRGLTANVCVTGILLPSFVVHVTASTCSSSTTCSTWQWQHFFSLTPHFQQTTLPLLFYSPLFFQKLFLSIIGGGNIEAKVGQFHQV